MDRTEKTELVAKLNRLFSEVSVVVVTRNHGLTVAQVTDLRNRMRAAGASYKVAKNRLARIALEGTPFVGISDLLVGPTGLATSPDPVVAAKIAIEFAKLTDKFEIVGAGMGAQVLDQSGVKALSELPSLDELRGKLVGLIQAPAQKLASLTMAPASKLARVFAAYGDPEREAA
ncbi:MAG: 50S ribosomal protein L10 [Sphingomonadaceae bacterium]|nr:50S ribosomal protein L10 [Sphingomonadaceae bacterium]